MVKTTKFTDFLAVNEPDWYQEGVTSFDNPTADAIAGTGDPIYVFVGSFVNRRHLAMLKGTFASDYSYIDWEDVSGRGTDRMYYARSNLKLHTKTTSSLSSRWGPPHFGCKRRKGRLPFGKGLECLPVRYPQLPLH